MIMPPYAVLSFLTLAAWLASAFYRKRALQRVHRLRAEELNCGKAPVIEGPHWKLFVAVFFGGDELFQRARNTGNLWTLFQELGSTFQREDLTGTASFFTNDLNNIKSILATDFDSWSLEANRGFVMDPFCGPGILSHDGAEWQTDRAVLQPIFKVTQKAYMDDWRTIVAKGVDSIPRDGRTVDLLPLCADMSSDGATSVFLGEPSGFVASRFGETPQRLHQVQKAFDYAKLGVAKRLSKPHYNVLTTDRKFWQSCNLFRQWAAEAVDLAHKNHDWSDAEPKRYVFIDELFRRGFSKKAARDSALNAMFAYRDSIANNLANVVFILARHPEHWARLREEVLSSGYMEASTSEDMIRIIQSMEFLKAVLNETLRVLPVFSFTGRTAGKDTTLPRGGGPDGSRPVYVRKGDRVTFSAPCIHRRPDLWGADATEFRPERWLQGPPPLPWSFMPFNGGPRVCPGQKLGMTQVSHALVSLVAAFERIENRDEVVEFQEVYALVAENRTGCQVGLLPPRSSAPTV